MSSEFKSIRRTCRIAVAWIANVRTEYKRSVFSATLLSSRLIRNLVYSSAWGSEAEFSMMEIPRLPQHHIVAHGVAVAHSSSGVVIATKWHGVVWDCTCVEYRRRLDPVRHPSCRWKRLATMSCLVTEMGPKLPDLHIGPSTHYDRLYVGLRDSNHSIRFYAHTDRNNDIHVAICQNSDNSTGKNHGFDSCCLASEKVGYQFPKLRLVISMLFYLKFCCRALILWVYILDFFSGLLVYEGQSYSTQVWCRGRPAGHGPIRKSAFCPSPQSTEINVITATDSE